MAWGTGPKTVLVIPGRPTNTLPEGPTRRAQPMFQALTDAGYRIWMVTRPRNMPTGHSIADIADDYAGLIRDEFDGQVSTTLGTSLGGKIAQYLAANHPDCAGTFVICFSACEASDWARATCQREAHAVATGNRTELGMVLGEALIPSDRYRWLRRLLAPLLARAMDGMTGDKHEP